MTIDTTPENALTRLTFNVESIFKLFKKNRKGEVAAWALHLERCKGTMHKDTVLGINPNIAIDFKDGDFFALRRCQYNQGGFFFANRT